MSDGTIGGIVRMDRARQLLRSLQGQTLTKGDVESKPVGALWAELVMHGYAALDGATGEDGFNRPGRAVFSVTPKGQQLLQGAPTRQELFEALFAIAHAAQELGLEPQLNNYRRGRDGIGAFDLAHATVIRSPQSWSEKCG